MLEPFQGNRKAAGALTGPGLQGGWSRAPRGRPWLWATPSSTPPYWALRSAFLLESLFKALEGAHRFPCPQTISLLLLAPFPAGPSPRVILRMPTAGIMLRV